MLADPDPVRRRRTFVAGQRGEGVALLWLALRGYRILARRYAVRGGEVDLIVRRGDCVVFVEVKARPTLEAAMTAVTTAQQQRINRAAAVWLSRHPWAAACTLRGDLVAVAPWRRPRHLIDAVPLTIAH